MNERGKTVSFWASQTNQERLEYAKKLELNVSQIVNELLEKHLKGYLEKAKADKTRQLRETLEAPVP
jgi:hypothetical protein